MFYVPKNAIYKRIDRRKFLELGGGAATALGAGSVAVGLSSVVTRNPVQAASSDDAKWKQYSGTKLVFMSENTPPSFAIRDNLKPFYDLTGIEVEILTDDLPVVQQKVGIDLRGGKADFQLNYVQDKPIGAPFADFYANLDQYAKDDTLPQDPDGTSADAWFENFLDACGTMYTRERLIAFPYDCAVACTFYRQDLFEKHSADFEKEYGYRMEFTKDSTWKNVYEFAEFFKKLRAAGQDVPYGYAQHQGSFAWTTQLDIQRMMFAHGRWTEFDVDDKLGSKTPGPTKWGDEASVFLMQKFKEQADVSHPDNLANATLQLNTVYQAGQIAMQVQYHEFAASIEDENTSKAAGGKTAYAPCPKGEASWIKNGGEAVNGTNCGIGGIGINNNASEDLKRAAYLFSLWSTSKDTQYSVLKGVGGTPTRKAVMGMPGVAEARKRPSTMPNALTFDAVYDYGIKDPHFVLGPKIPEANEYYQIILTEVQRCLSGQTDAGEACEAIRSQVDDLHDL
ncbi:MAG TPA: extracellular solute-binding protein [Geminicoccus sp.]|jgi:multiple sugar transport system substrate-binding protein|uniref:extracellular solute-binding protein n=1 Tax=Geminicoccus sp. TaxID=2024832 RepID=UPI002E324441|nr:extracellular solute-binding protein [Geminicoccus sp.]HEX2529282.1 extracellular solute-binding protein [Geminicoccus sp.]